MLHALKKNVGTPNVLSSNNQTNTSRSVFTADCYEGSPPSLERSQPEPEQRRRMFRAVSGEAGRCEQGLRDHPSGSGWDMLFVGAVMNWLHA